MRKYFKSESIYWRFTVSSFTRPCCNAQHVILQCHTITCWCAMELWRVLTSKNPLPRPSSGAWQSCALHNARHEELEDRAGGRWNRGVGNHSQVSSLSCSMLLSAVCLSLFAACCHALIDTSLPASILFWRRAAVTKPTSTQGHMGLSFK